MYFFTQNFTTLYANPEGNFSIQKSSPEDYKKICEFYSYLPPKINLPKNILLQRFFLTYWMLLQTPLELDLNPEMSYSDTASAYLKYFKQEQLNRFYSGFGNNWNPPEGYLQKNVLDSNLNNIRSFEEFDSSQVNYTFPISLDEYLEFRKHDIRQEIWDSLITKYDIKKAMSQGDISKTLMAATGISIPIPSNPLMSIFGKPEISIGVNGEVNLRIGWRFDSQNLGTQSSFGQTQSTPIFNQDIRVNVNAKIGDKLSFGTDWNTRNNYDLNNKFKIGFEGYDDDIVKLVELGNVNFPINSTLIGGGQSLFGARADFQFGPLYLKTVFSQRRGQRKFVDVKGGVNKQPFTLRAYDYSKKHFFIDSVYKPIYDDYFKNSTPVIPNTPDAQKYRIKRIQVFESTNDIREGVIRAGNSVAIADLPGKRLLMGERYTDAEKNRPIQAGVVERGNFVLLDSMQYSYDGNLGTLYIKNLRQDRYYAVSYAIEGETLSENDNVYYGTFTNDVGTKDTLILKLIYRPNPLPSYKILWGRMMKNIYEINASNVNINETKINLWYIRENNDSTDVLQGAPDKLVTIFGVDRVNNSTGTAPPDGLFDLRPPFFDAVNGELTFPSSEPFGKGLRAYFDKIGNPELASQYTFEQVYDTTYDIAARNTARDRFVISGEVTASRSANRIALGAYNLAPGSVKVSLDGVPLREYQDYTVDYYAGNLTIKNQRATIPNANLRVEYEQQDILNIATKTLAGIRADYNLFKNRYSSAVVGATFMHYDQSAVVDRVRIGDEPVANTMFGFDGKFNLDIPFLTKLVDYLPFYDTKVPSTLNMQGEWAMILPNPNKRTSEVSSDNGSPVVYIDDFESAQRTIPLGLSPTTWQYSSAPVDFLIDSTALGRSLYKGNVFWYQHTLPYINISDVYPNNNNNIQGRRLFSPLEINFSPDIRGIYNMNRNYLDSNNKEYDPNNSFSKNPENRKKIWGGFQKLISQFSTNFDTENIEYIEIMMNVQDNEYGAGRMFIDLGQISEDIIPDNKLSTEDGFTEGSPFPNGIIDAGEDVGIDQMDDKKEKEVYPPPLNEEDDPARDDYYFDFGKRDNERRPFDFMKYNRFENNSKYSELGQFPDKEILNDNNGQTISLADDYYSYEVNLNTDPNNNPQIVGGNPSKGWYLFRIPIRKPNNVVGHPSFANVQYLRVRFQGGSVKLLIEKWQLVGAQWQRTNDFQSVPASDSVMQVSFVNYWDNAKEPDFYSMPPGVTAPRLLNNTDPYTDVKLNEQSLKIAVKDLNYGEERMATRIFRSLDIFNYKVLKFFIHGDALMPVNFVQNSIPKAYTFLRFGIDSMNYYEYRRPLTRDWQDLQINLEELTAIKQSRDTSLINKVQTFPVKSDSLAHFVIRGNPILTRIQFFGFGIANPSEQFPNQLTTTIWVDELRLINPERRSDWAAVGNVDLKIADLAQVNLNFQTSNPNFHKIEDRFGNRVSANSWSFNVTGNLEKFAPPSFSGMKLPITFTHTEQSENPEYVANNDINLSEAATSARDIAYINAVKNGSSQQEANSIAQSTYNSVLSRSQTMRVSDNWALTQVKLGIPIKHWLMENTLNALTLGYTYSQDYERSPIYEQRFNWIWKFNLQYGLKINDFLSFSPFKWLKNVPVIGIYSAFKVNPLPSAINTTFDFMRRRQTEQSRYLDVPSPVLREFNAQRQGQFSWKITENSFLNPLIDYNFNSTSTLVPYELNSFGKQRSGSELSKIIFLNNGTLVNFGNNTLHSQVITLNTKPKIPDFFGISRFFDITAIYSSTYNWQDPLQPDPAIRDIAKSASVNTNLRINNALKLKALGDNWFKSANLMGTRVTAADTTKSIWGAIGNVVKTIFLDWDKVDFNLTQTNSSINPGVFGGNGFNNFWSRGFLGRSDENMFGPSFPYQLGLVSDPHGGFSIGPSSKFPYFSFNTFSGLRPPNAVLQDNFRQQSTLEIKTSRRLWEGATLDLTWKTDLGYNKNQTLLTDSNGVARYTNLVAVNNLNRSFLTFPSIFGLNLFGNTIEDVVKNYNQKKAQIDAMPIDSIRKNQLLQEALSNSFYNQLSAFRFIGGDAGKFLPSVNWAFRWEGLEKWSILKNMLKRLSLEHIYQSTYQESIQTTDLGRFIQTQTVQYGFQPLIGLTASFDEKKLKGAMTATLRWSTQKSFMINTTARSVIAAQSTNDITTQVTYTLRGFDFPIFGIKLKNDVELSFLGTYKSNKNSTYDIMNKNSYQGGNSNNGWTLNGNTQIIIEPRARYTLSNIVSASLFVRYEGTFTEGAAQPGYHTTQFGLDIRIAISGGR